jgi:hypothetical protein
LAGAPQRDRCRRAFELAWQRPACFSHRRWGSRLDRALARADRFANFGRGCRGAGAAALIGVIEGSTSDLVTGDPMPGSLAYYVPIIDAISKDWRRSERRRQKAALEAARTKGGRSCPTSPSTASADT